MTRVVSGANLFAAAQELERRNRRVSAYQLFDYARTLATPTRKQARTATWLAARFGDAAMFESMQDIALAGPAHDEAWSNKAKQMLERFLPFDANEARELLSLRGRRGFEPLSGRLCYALSSSPPAISGYATRTKGMAEGMKHAGLDVVGLTRPGYPWDRDADAAASNEDVVGGITFQHIRHPLRSALPRRNYVKASIDAWQVAIEAMRPAAVVAASNWETALPAQIAARRLGLPFFYEVRGFWEMSRASEEEGFETTALYAAWANLEALTACSADYVFTLTEAMRDELVLRGVPLERISLIPNACDVEQFVPCQRDAELSARLDIPEGVPVIGYVGSFNRYEGLELLIEACGRLRAEGRVFRLLLVGAEPGGVGAYSERLKELAEQNGIGGWTVMPGRVHHDHVPAYYSLIDVTPFPRISHAVTEKVSPLKPMEAMAMHKAVVVSDLRALSEMVRHEDTGLVFANGDVRALADTLGGLLTDPARRTRLGANGRRFVERERTWNFVGKSARDRLVEIVPDLA